MVMGLIIGVGFIFYFVGETVINNLYQSSLSTDDKLLSVAGISSFSSVSKSEIQSRVDKQIWRYTNLLNTQSRTLSSIKNTLENVEKFHSILMALNLATDKVNGKISFSYFRYVENSATPLYFIQFRTDKSTEILYIEKKVFESLGYKTHIEKFQTSNWYKASNDALSISRGGS